ncbi:M3 family metallopeptidase [Sphingomonas sp. CFBP 13720]|uniref:M3 family metallopeptidase n=1 Tax=Sphingomonas sp. CFBP 13720 TaxID=2775302 RepID=UPI00177D4F62|nr:M3 family metallopeptidase [Sphingomonas sp. CFBP 13720]MBD8679331.1 M3 family metallopeptidase [Sphingomonas sp. CFBP 13720]
MIARIGALLATSALALPAVGAAMPQAPVPAAPAAAPAPAPAAIDATPLTAKWTGPYEGVPPWDKVTAAMFPVAFPVAMADMRREIHAIRDDRRPATFATVIEPMQLAGDMMDRVGSMWGVYTSNLADKDVQAIDREWSPKLSKFNDELFLDPKLFQRVKAAYDTRATQRLNAQQMRLLERTYRSFVRRGALLNDAQRTQVSAINQQLSGVYNDFSRKVLADEETWIVVDDARQLAGLPESFVASLKSAADERGLAGKWAIVNTRSSVAPVLTYAADRSLREKVWRAFTMRGDNGNANDTKATIATILKLRQERAKLLGFRNHAYLRMDDTMAETPANAKALMMRVWPAAVARVREEVADMQAIAGTGITIAPWDYRFYAEKVRKAKYDLDESEVKPYLQLDNIVQAAFYAAGRLYDLKFTENTGQIPVFEKNVRTFVVTDARDGSNVGVFYLDNFARSGKRSGAWATRYRGQQKLGGDTNVLASNNNNFLKGGAGQPTLISLDDATTLFHEFGHAIHSLVQDVTYPGLSGTPRDFVEYPSQVNENWLLTRDVLDRFAKHYQTGQAMPQALVDKIDKSSTFNQGFATVEYLSSAIVDMELHDRAEPVADVAAFERDTLARIGMPKEMVMRHRLPQFNHLFASDAYSAGYYSYLWSETMDADTWAAFEATGNVWDKATADRFRTTLLATGNETDRKEAYRAFRGRDPDVTALFRRRGFPVE